MGNTKVQRTVRVPVGLMDRIANLNEVMSSVETDLTTFGRVSISSITHLAIMRGVEVLERLYIDADQDTIDSERLREQIKTLRVQLADAENALQRHETLADQRIVVISTAPTGQSKLRAVELADLRVSNNGQRVVYKVRGEETPRILAKTTAEARKLLKLK